VTLSRPPRIWVMTKEYFPRIIGGLGTVATDLSRTLAQGRASVTIWSTASDDRATCERRKNRTECRLPANDPYYNKSAYSYNLNPIVRQARRHGIRKPDAIHVHSMEFAKAALSIKRKYRIPVVYTCHSLIGSMLTSVKSKKRRDLQFALLKGSDVIVVPSEWLGGEIRRRCPSAAGKIKVIPHGVKTSKRRPQAPLHRLLFVGRLIPSKGIIPLVNAVGRLKREHGNIELTIIGKGSPKYTRRIGNAARLNRVASRVKFAGFLNAGQLRRRYRNYGAVVVPSREESFCLVALEAMANGVPLVSTQAGGLKEFVNRGNAKIIPKVTSVHIAKAIHRVLSKPGLARIRADRALKTARTYTWPRAADQYARLFRRLRAKGK